MLSPQNDTEEFGFYIKFAKPLILSLPDTNDRIKAAAWIRRLQAEPSESEQKNNYLKLLLFVLQRRRLIGPFSFIPDENEPLPAFPEEINIQDVAKSFVEIDKKVLKETLERGGYGEWPPFTVACSSDLTEYSSSQVIPNFGIQVYFAISKDPLHVWNHFDKAVLPIGENIDFTKAEGSIADTVSPNISCFVSPEQTKLSISPRGPAKSPRSPITPKSEPTITSPLIVSKEITPKKASPPGIPGVSPKTPKKESPIKDEFQVGDRIPPTWGSNLVNVKETSPIRRPVTPSPIKDLDVDVSDQDMLDFFNDDIDLYDEDEYEDDEDDFAQYLQGDALISPQPPTPRTPLTPKELFDEMETTMLEKSGIFDQSAVQDDTTPQTCPGERPCPKSKTPSPAKLKTPSPAKLRTPSPKQVSPAKLRSPSPRQVSPAKLRTPGSSLSPESAELARLEAEVFGRRTPRQKQFTEEEELLQLETEVFGKPVTHAEYEKLLSPEKEIALRVQEIIEDFDKPSTSALEQYGDIVEKTILDTSGEGLGGTSFIAPEQKDFQWLSKVKQGEDFPEEGQNEDLWESFGWWTDDPDEIFDYLPPSPRARTPDPRDAMMERWADVPPTPPLFSKDPKIREKASDRIYGIEEFGMESFEEPVWTSATQYFKYKTQPSPFKDSRQEDRKSLDLSKVPKHVSPKFDRQLSDIQGEPEEEQFFERQSTPKLDDISFSAHDYVPMSKTEAVMEAVKTGPRYMGFHTPESEKGEWTDVSFLAKTPPKFMSSPQFLFTPPPYEENAEAAAEVEDSISKYIDEDLKIIHSKVPATMPQRSPSPRRPPPLTTQTPPFTEGFDIEPGTTLPSPRTPEKYIVPPQRQIDWDTDIGTTIDLPPPKPGYYPPVDEVIMSREKKRLKEIADVYEKQYASPERFPTPPPLPSIMDQPIPYAASALPPPMSPERGPPIGWTYETPSRLKTGPYKPKRIVTPTGLTPTKKITQDMTMYFESPPAEMLSPSEAVSAIAISPPQEFFKEPCSPVCVASPTKTPPRLDALDMVQIFPREDEILEEEIPEWYKSPKRDIPSPESLEWKEKVLGHEKFKPPKKAFLIRPKPGRQYRVTKSRTPSLGTLEEISSPKSPRMEEEEIPYQTLRQSAAISYRDRPGFVKPKRMKELARLKEEAEEQFDYDRGIAGEIAYHRLQVAPIAYPDRPDFIRPKSDIESRKLKEEAEAQFDMEAAINRGGEPIMDYAKICQQSNLQLEDYFSRMEALETERAQIKSSPVVADLKLKQRLAEVYRTRPVITSPKSPVPSPKTPPHIFDEPVPAGLPPALLPPSGWNYKTPPKYQIAARPPRQRKTPSGVSPVGQITGSIPMFFESPPEEYTMSPSEAVKAIAGTPPKDFLPPSPILSPGGRAMAPVMPQARDVVDIAKIYPEDYEAIDGDRDVLVESPISEWQETVKQHKYVGVNLFRKPIVVPGIYNKYKVRDQIIPELDPIEEASPEGAYRFSPGPGPNYRWRKFIEGHQLERYKPRAYDVYPGVTKRHRIRGTKSPRLRDIAETSPETAQPISPGPSRKWKKSLKEHEPVEYIPTLYDVYPQGGRIHRIQSAKAPRLPNIIEQRVEKYPESPRRNIDEEIAILEAEIFGVSPERKTSTPIDSGASPVTPEFKRKMFKASLKLHKPSQYSKKEEGYAIHPTPHMSYTMARRSGPPSLSPVAQSPEQIADPRVYKEFERSQKAKSYKKTMEALRKQKDAQLAADVEKIQFTQQAKPPYEPYVSEETKFLEEMKEHEASLQSRRAQLREQLMERELYQSPPTPVGTPVTPPHILDEELPVGLPSALLPPISWSYKTPPKYKPVQQPTLQRKSPSGVSPVGRISTDIDMYFESPPQEILSPTEAVSAIAGSPPFSLKPTSPLRSPGGRPVTAQLTEVKDILDIAQLYPEQFEDNIIGTPPSPAPGWNEAIMEHEPVVYTKKSFVVTPKAGTSKLETITETSPLAGAAPVLSPGPTREKWQREIQRHKPVDYIEKTFVVRPGGRHYHVVKSKTTPLDTIEEKSPDPAKIKHDIKEAHLNRSIAELEAELFGGELDISPEKKSWKAKVGAHEKVPFKRKTFIIRPKYGKPYPVVPPKVPKLDTVTEVSPKMSPVQKSPCAGVCAKGKTQVPSHFQPIMESTTIKESAQPQYSEEEKSLNRWKNWKLQQPIEIISPPERTPSPESPVHILDEAIPTGLPTALLPPSNWNYKTPPRLVQRPQPLKNLQMAPMRVFDMESLQYESPPLVTSPSVSPRTITSSPRRQSPLSPRKTPSAPCGPCTSPKETPPGAPQLPVVIDEIEAAQELASYKEDLLKETEPELIEEITEIDLFTPDDMAEDEVAELIEEVFGPKQPVQKTPVKPTQPIRSRSPEESPVTPELQRKIWQQELALRDVVPVPKKTFIVKPKAGKSYKVTKGKKPSLPSVEEQYLEMSPVSPLSPFISTESPRVSPVPGQVKTPENWAWKTPSPLKAPTPRQPTPPLNIYGTAPGLYSESPPLDEISPETPWSPLPATSVISFTETPTASVVSLMKKYKPKSPLRSPGGRPVQIGRPDEIDIAGLTATGYDAITEELSPEYYTVESPPIPPPRPATPAAFYPQPRRIRPRGVLDPNILVAITPPSAEKPREPILEAINFEPTVRQKKLVTVLPETYYETPIIPRERPWRVQKRKYGLPAKRRLVFDEDEEEDYEMAMAEQLQQAVPVSDVLAESPPQAVYEQEDTSFLGDIDYEPGEFGFYREDVPDYDVQPAFQGQPDPLQLDTSMIQVVDRIPPEERDFRWMDCGSRCPWSPDK